VRKRRCSEERPSPAALAYLENAGGHVVSGLAALGNAAAHHPGDLLTAAAGAG
jgi:hypothetical protein